MIIFNDEWSFLFYTAILMVWHKQSIAFTLLRMKDRRITVKPANIIKKPFFVVVLQFSTLTPRWVPSPKNSF